jgi:hypothetical protein
MTKAMITRLFVGSLLAVVGGLVLLFIGAVLGYANNAFQMNGPDVIGIQSNSAAWTVVALVAISLVAMLGGAIGQLVAWIGAVLNTAQLQRPTAAFGRLSPGHLTRASMT